MFLISNHVSWIDISVLSAVAPVSFVAKQEVASWPFVSWLAKLQRSVFIDRNRRSEVGDKANEILNRLAAGDHIVLFAEGTSSDGNSVIPFKTSLFAAAKPPGGRAHGGQGLGADARADLQQSLWACRSAGEDATSSPGMARWIWQATPGGFSGLGRSTPMSASGRRCRSTNFPTARRSPAMPRTRCATTWPSFCADRSRRPRTDGCRG